MEYLGIDLSCAVGSLRNGSFPPQECLLPLISKLLGYAIVAASTTVKLPQIMKILKHKSVRGLSLTAFELEVVGYTIALAYCLHTGLPFSAYGELVFLLIQAPTVLAGQIDPILFEALYVSGFFHSPYCPLPPIDNELLLSLGLLPNCMSVFRDFLLFRAVGVSVFSCTNEAMTRQKLNSVDLFLLQREYLPASRKKHHQVVSFFYYAFICLKKFHGSFVSSVIRPPLEQSASV
ncbi:hypothetical protein V6N13_011908 [Hibiscus sabdariffa]